MIEEGGVRAGGVELGLDRGGEGNVIGADVLEEENLTPNFLFEKIKSIMFSEKEYAKMSRGAQNFAKPDASRIFAAYILEYLRKGQQS